MWRVAEEVLCLVALSRQIIVIVGPSVLGFDDMIQRFEITAIGMCVLGI